MATNNYTSPLDSAEAPSTRQQQQQRQRQQRQETDNIDTSAHLSLAAMSTTTTNTTPAAATTAIADDVSSVGENTTQYSRQSGRRKRKDDCSESRCTQASEGSGASRSRRRRLLTSPRHRWLVDRKATLSDAPIRPRRSADGPPPSSTTTTAAYGFSQSLRGLGTAPTALENDNYRAAATSGRGYHTSSNTEAARELSRCQSMTLPPVRPTRTRDDSQSDLTIKSESSSDSEDETDKNEFDPDMFARLLKGQQVPSTGRTSAMGPPSIRGPPILSRRASDAGSYLYSFQQKERKESLIRSRAASMTANDKDRTTSHVGGDRHQNMRDKWFSSPKPPAKPSRTFDGIVGGNSVRKTRAPQDLLLDAPSPPTLPRVSGRTAITARESHGEVVRMDCEVAEADVKDETATEEKEVVEDIEEGQEDLTEVSAPASVKEYDHDLFQRLLSGDASASPVPTTSASTEAVSISAPDPPPPLVARVSSCATATVTNGTPAYNRFDNSITCTTPEHFQGAMKSSHPPMRPRRSLDIGDPEIISLATATAAYCMAQMPDTSGIIEASMMSEETTMPRPISIVGGKRRAPRRSFSRRQTLPLAVDPDEGADTEKTQAGEPYDPTQEANLVAFSSSSDEPCGEDCPDGRKKFEQKREDEEQDLAKTTSGSYLRILPIRRPMVRRSSMPSKGMTFSPLSKKPRIGRSASCHSTSDDSMNSPAAA